MQDDGAYVSVLVDGDCVLVSYQTTVGALLGYSDGSVQFKDEHIRRGVTGGTEAAGMLVNGVREFLSEHVACAPARISIHIRIYANVKGLGQAYYNAGILFDPSDVWSFMRGFNMGHPMCDFIDAGDGKECSDDKLKGKADKPNPLTDDRTDYSPETFRSNISNVHCKQILLACSADNGYARLLAPLKADKDAVQLVTLVEGPPFASELLHLTEAFPTHSFPTIFRSSKLTTRPRSPPYGSTPRYAAVAAAGVPQQASPIQDSSIPSPIWQRIARNAQGQRIDRHLEYSQHLAKLLQKRKLCNFFHLFGECRFENCTHHHGARLSGDELNALAHVARLTPCRSGLGCDSQQCILGHQCPFGDKCMGKRCRFPESMHGIDTMIVS